MAHWIPVFAEMVERKILSMLHRHLNHQELTLAAIDDLIARGKQQDWVELRRAVLADQTVLEKVLRVCRRALKVDSTPDRLSTFVSEDLCTGQK